MANYFSKYTGRKGPAIAPGIIEMMGSIGEEYGKGIEKLGEGIANYRKNKAEKNKAEADFENAITRMSNLYGEESIIYSVDDKTMSKLESGKGTKEDFLSAFNSLNTMEESIEENRKREEDARRFGVTTDIQREQLKATQELGYARIGSAESEGAAGRVSREGMHRAGLVSAEGEGAAGRASREGMHAAGLTSAESEGAAGRASREGMHAAGITSAEAMQTKNLAQAEDHFKDKLDQDFFLEMGRQGLSREEIDQRYTIHRESSDQAWNLAQDKLTQQQIQFDATLTETQRVNQIKENVDARIIENQQAGLIGYSTYLDKTQLTFDPDAHSAAMSGAGSLGGPTPAQLQSYMDNPEQFKRQLTSSERAVKALQTPGLSLEVQESIAKMANAEAGTGGVKFVKHPVTGEYVMAVGPTGSMSQLPTSGKSATEISVDYQRERDRIRAIENKQTALAEAKKARLTSLQKLLADPLYDEDDPVYKKAEADWDDLITEIGGGEKIPEYGRDGKLKN